jgi:hypothetical protein
MDLIASPMTTIILNLVAQVLVSRGVLDVSYRDQFIQIANSSIAAGATLIIGLYSIYKMIDLKKHQLTVNAAATKDATTATTTITTPVKTEVSPASQTTQLVVTPIHTGLPAST